MVVRMMCVQKFCFIISKIVILVLCTVSLVNANTPHKRFEYKYSFKPPYLAQKDGSVPFWEYGGSKY